MSVEVICECGERLAVAAALAGLSVRCRACGKSVPVPRPDGRSPPKPAAADTEQSRPDPATAAGADLPGADRPPDGPKAIPGKTWGRKKRAAPAPTKIAEANPSDDPDEPKQKPDFRHSSGRKDESKLQTMRRGDQELEDDWLGTKELLNAGAVAGLVVAVVSAVWFVVGLMNDIFFFFLPFIFVIGLAGFLRGITGRK